MGGPLIPAGGGGGSVEFLTDVVTPSGVSSMTWDIPDGCQWFRWQIDDGAAISDNINMQLLKASDGLAASFMRVINRPNSGSTALAASTTSPQSMTVTTATVYGGWGDVWLPRSATKKTRGHGEWWINIGNIIRKSDFTAITAEDHDTFQIDLVSGTFTHTVEFTYLLGG